MQRSRSTLAWIGVGSCIPTPCAHSAGLGVAAQGLVHVRGTARPPRVGIHKAAARRGACSRQASATTETSTSEMLDCKTWLIPDPRPRLHARDRRTPQRPPRSRQPQAPRARARRTCVKARPDPTLSTSLRRRVYTRNQLPAEIAQVRAQHSVGAVAWTRPHNGDPTCSIGNPTASPLVVSAKYRLVARYRSNSARVGRANDRIAKRLSDAVVGCENIPPSRLRVRSKSKSWLREQIAEFNCGT